MTVLGEVHDERKEAGRALMREILTLVQLRQHGEVHLASIGGFDLIYEGERFGKADGYRYATLLQRTGADYEIDLAVTVTPLGAISASNMRSTGSGRSVIVIAIVSKTPADGSPHIAPVRAAASPSLRNLL